MSDVPEKCAHCTKDKTFHDLKILADGTVVEKHACEDCAAEQGFLPVTLSVEGVVDAGSTADASAASSPEHPGAKTRKPRVRSRACPQCGLTYMQFKRVGRLGCPACYAAFERQLMGILERSQEGGMHHVGKIPRRLLRDRAAAGETPLAEEAGGGEAHASADTGEGGTHRPGLESLLGGAQQRAQKLKVLGEQLRAAVESEQYEQAARIRDELSQASEPPVSKSEALLSPERRTRLEPASRVAPDRWTVDLDTRCPEWLRGEGPQSDVVVSSRVRLARNLAGLSFPSKATRDEAELVLTRVRAQLESFGSEQLDLDLRRCPKTDGKLLVERQLISAALLAGRKRSPKKAGENLDPRGVVTWLSDEQLAVMINEEDHVRIQSLRSGFDLPAALRAADEIDDVLEAGLDYAFDARLGYLTACPTNVGTGARFSVMLHLPGLALTGDLERATRAAHDMSLAVRGFYGEGTRSAGDFFQLSNQTTLGRSEGMLLDDMSLDIVPQLIEYERESRRKLMDSKRVLLEDRVFRALGTARSARLLSSEEAMKLLSLIRLGVVLELFEGVSLRTVHDLMLMTQPMHLSLVSSKPLGTGERRAARAALMRESFCERKPKDDTDARLA